MAMHSQPLPALHEFATVMDAKMLVNHIVDFCSLHSSYLEAVPAHAVSAESFARVRAVAGDDRSRAVAIFQVEAGVDRELAEALVADLAGAHPTVLIRTQPFLATEQEQGKSLSILNGDLAIWTIAECETRGGQPAVEIQPTTEQMLRLRLQSMVTQHHEK